MGVTFANRDGVAQPSVISSAPGFLWEFVEVRPEDAVHRGEHPVGRVRSAAGLVGSRLPPRNWPRPWSRRSCRTPHHLGYRPDRRKRARRSVHLGEVGINYTRHPSVPRLCFANSVVRHAAGYEPSTIPRSPQWPAVRGRDERSGIAAIPCRLPGRRWPVGNTGQIRELAVRVVVVVQRQQPHLLEIVRAFIRAAASRTF